MNLKTDKKKSPLKGVYIFYSVIIALCILALFVFNLNIYAKAVLCTLAFLCVCIMRSLKNAMILPPDIDPNTMQKVEDAEYVEAETVEKPTEETDSTIKKGGVIDTYLSLLIETDEELSSDPSVDTYSRIYNMLLNHRISMKLDAMSQSNNPSDKD